MDTSLITRAKRGDHQAFNSLIEEHREVLFRYAYLIVRDRTIAEDITQDAVLKIYHVLNHFDETRPFRPWAISITRNLARNNRRSFGRYKHAITRLITGWNERTQASAETLTQTQQQAKMLHDAVEQLQTNFQDVIYARYFMGLSVEDCAVALSIAEGTVKSRSHRALKQLRAVIERDYPELVEDYYYA